MQTKTHDRPHSVCWSQSFLGTVTFLFQGMGTVAADLPGPAQIRIRPEMSEPSVSLGVEVTLLAASHGGTGPFTYIWRLNGHEVAEATLAGAALELGSVKLADAGEYTVLVRNAEGEALSTPFTLAVDPTFASVPLATRGVLYAAQWVDINGDGWLDLGAAEFRTSPTAVWRLFLSSRDGAFVAAWEEAFPNALGTGVLTCLNAL